MNIFPTGESTMRRFMKILVVFDNMTDNRALLYHAVNLAQRNQTSLTVVDILEETPAVLANPVVQTLPGSGQVSNIQIFEEFPSKSASLVLPERPQNHSIDVEHAAENIGINIQEVIHQEEQHSFDQFVSSIKRTGIKLESNTIIGIPFIEIIREVLRNRYDLVMITADGSGKKSGTRFGNTTMHLLRKCPCPVWVIKPGSKREFKRVLAAVDLDQDDQVRVTLNNRIIEVASSIARIRQSELIIFHAWKMVGESIIKGRGGFSSTQIEGLLQETRELHRRRLIGLLQQHSLGDLNHEVYLIKGEAGNLIPELTRAKSVDLLVMGTVSRSGIAGLLIGNTAEKVLGQVDSSILAIKPEGFITPIKLDPQ